MSTTELARYVEGEASKRYNDGYGWQVICECMTTSEIEKALSDRKVKSKSGAMKWAREFAGLHQDQHDDVSKTAF